MAMDCTVGCNMVSLVHDNSQRQTTAGALSYDTYVGKVASYADVVRGIHMKSSDVTDAVRQPVVNGRR